MKHEVGGRIGLGAALLALAACQTYVRPLATGAADGERDSLVERVVAARNAQANVRGQIGFASANFAAVATVEPEYVELTDAAGTHHKLTSNHRLVEARAAGLHERIERVARAGETAFAAWQEALDEYPDAAARRAREERLAATRSAYEDLLEPMRRAERSLEPLLDAYAGHVAALRRRRASDADLRNLRADLDRIAERTEQVAGELEDAVARADAFVAMIQDESGAAAERRRGARLAACRT